MNHARTVIASAALVIAALAMGCGGAEPVDEAVTPAPVEAGEVAYEPAYPEDVSTEELTAEDTRQQQTHAHGGEEHTHDRSAKDDHDHEH